MKKILAFAVILGLAIFAAIVVAKPAPPTVARCQRIHAATRALEDAITETRDAGHDFGGHKEDALRAAAEACQQLHLAEGCDKCR